MTNKFPSSNINAKSLHALQAAAAVESKEQVVGGLIVNEHNQLFFRKRSHNRALFPGCWDITGGHVETGETFPQALAREIEEETGWQFIRILALVHVFDWELETEDQVIEMREFDFLVEISGDLENPQIEEDKFTEYRWVGEEDLQMLKQNRPPDDFAIFNIAQKA